MDVLIAESAPVRLNIGLGRGLEFFLLEASEIEDKSIWRGGGKDEIVVLAEWSGPTEEMCELFSAGTDVKGFMLEIASSNEDTREGTSLVRAQP